MADHSRPAPASPPRKKARPPVSRKKYFFQPQNTLAYKPTSAEPKQSPHKSPTAGKPPAATPLLNASHLASLPHWNGPSALPKDAPCNPDKSLEIQQSSDDSFDGVRWRAPIPAALARPIPSSPLRNADILDTANASEPATVLNEITDSVLSKYGMAMPNSLSQTPSVARTRSCGDGITLEASPTFTRSKSFDPRSLPSSEAALKKEDSRLDLWIDKFADKPALGPPQAAKQLPQLPGSDDFSSDDDTFLANLKADSFNPALQMVVSKNVLKGGKSAEKAESTASVESFNDTDPFSDDLDIAALESFSQPSTATNSFSATKAHETKLNLSESSVKRSASAEPGAEPILPDNLSLSFSRPGLTRYKITGIFRTSYTSGKFRKQQTILSVQDAGRNSTKIIVRGETAELDYKEDDIIHIIDTGSDNSRLVDDSHNLLIWHPDILVPSTTVADQLFCPRKSVLTNRLRMPGELSIPLIVGNIVHELFQLCFLTEIYTREYLENALEEKLLNRLLEIFSIGDCLAEVRRRIEDKLPAIIAWFETFYKKSPKEIPTNKRQQKIRFSVADALDIEESLWSPMFGIKGNVDVTIKAFLEGESAQNRYLLPMEIKTGEPHLSHQAQASLYSLLFKDRYNADISSFVLLYTSAKESTTKHDISAADLRSLVNLRNRISVYLQFGNQELPDLMRQQKCDRCSIQQSCMTYNYLIESGTLEDSGLRDGTYEGLTAHLQSNEDYKEFLSVWDMLLSKEEEFASRFNADLWKLPSQERESTYGNSLGNLVITQSIDNVRTNRAYIYRFERETPTANAMNSTQLRKNDKVIISDEAGNFGIAQGTILDIGNCFVTISSSRKIISTEVKSDRFHRAAVLRRTQDGPSQTLTTVRFRIDLNEMFYGMGMARFNVLNLFQADGDHKRRKLIVDLEAPTYSTNSMLSAESCPVFNSDQRKVLEKLGRTQDYLLILGMPGTGKTTTIAHIIHALVEEGKSVLLSSHTNSAVDNILLKLKELKVDFARIGLASRVHPEIRDYIPGSAARDIESYEDYARFVLQPRVVAATCLSVGDIMFGQRERFDYCFIDEASQVAMPISLGPIALADKFVLVGDHNQLPPLVTNPDAKIRSGLSKSLFEMLAHAHPQSVIELTHQYRMCSDIMLVANKLVYNDKLLCGSERVAEQTLKVNISKLKPFIQSPHQISSSWLGHVLNEDTKVTFLNHDNVPGAEMRIGENVTNPLEARLIAQMVEALVACGVDASRIGVMTLYRSQLKLLADSLRQYPLVEVLTVDRFQGRDKDCIFFSMVRSNDEGRTGNLITDWRRINVAITRAKSKLVLVGSKRTVAKAPSMNDFLKLAIRRDWIYELPQDVLDVYQFLRLRKSPERKHVAKGKVGSHLVNKHPIVRGILADMNINQNV